MGIKRILFATDFGHIADRAKNTVIYLAEHFGAEIFLMHAVDPDGIFTGGEEERRKKATAQLDALIKEIDNGKTSYHKIVKAGNPLNMIVESAQEHDINLIVMGTVGGSGLADVIGSNANYVVHHAPCPVLSIKVKPKSPEINKILLPIDLSRETKELVDWGIIFAKIFDAELEVFGVVPFKDAAAAKKLSDRLVLAIQHIKKEGVVNVSYNTITADKTPGKLTLAHAEMSAVDLVFIMTQQEEAQRESLTTITSDYIVNHSNIPVLSITPSLEYESKHYVSQHFT